MTPVLYLLSEAIQPVKRNDEHHRVVRRQVCGWETVAYHEPL